MKFESYDWLEQFGKRLMENGFDTLTTEELENSKDRFAEMYHENKEQLEKRLLSDLENFFPIRLSISSGKIYFEDEDVQGASHIDFKVKVSENNYLIELRLRCLIFFNRIILSFDVPEILDFKLSKGTLKTLHKFNRVSEYHFMTELRSLE